MNFIKSNKPQLVIYAEQVMNDKVSMKEPIYPWSYILSMFFGAAFLFFGTAYATDQYKFTTPIVSPRFFHYFYFSIDIQ